MRYLLVSVDEVVSPQFETRLTEFVREAGGYITTRDLDASECKLSNCGEDLARCSGTGISLVPLKNLDKVLPRRPS